MSLVTDNRIKLFIFSNQPLFREGIRSWLSQKPDMEVMGDTSVTNTAILLSLQLMPPEVVILDIDCPDKSGLGLAHRLKNQLPDVKLIVLKSYFTDDDLVEALKVQISAYLHKDTSGDDLLDIIRHLAYTKDFTDETLISRPGVVKAVISELRELSGDELFIDEVSCPLRPREKEVISYVSQGYSNKEIGVKLGISEQTVKCHVSSIIDKSGAKDRTEAAVKAIKNGWIACAIS